MAFDFGELDKAIEKQEMNQTLTHVIEQKSDESKAVNKKPEVKMAEVVETTPFDHFDIEKTKTNFIQYQTKISDLFTKASELKVVDEVTNKTANEMLIQLSQILKLAGQVKDNLPGFKVAREFKNSVDKFFRVDITNPIKSIQDHLKPKISKYAQTVAELERRKKEKEEKERQEKLQAESAKQAAIDAENARIEREEAIALQAKLDAEADAAGVERVEVEIPPELPPIEMTFVETPAEVVAEKTEKVAIDGGTSTMKGEWKCEIIDEDLIPPQYRIPSQKLLDEAVKAGVREIPGTKIFEHFEPRVRVSMKNLTGQAAIDQIMDEDKF